MPLSCSILQMTVESMLLEIPRRMSIGTTQFLALLFSMRTSQKWMSDLEISLLQEAYLSLTTKTLVFLQHITQNYEADFIMKVCRPLLVCECCTPFTLNLPPLFCIHQKAPMDFLQV